MTDGPRLDEVEARRNPVVSAIIIFLDEERFLPEAVASVIAQTYDRWELLLVDDGSRDHSTAAARSYAARDPTRIRYLEHDRHENRGMSASRNLGLQHARGDFIAFLDADDVWLPQKLERQVELLEAHPKAGMVYGRTEFWHSWSGNPDDRGSDHTLPLGFSPNTLIQPPDLLPLLLKNEEQLPAPSDALFRREILTAVGGWDETFRSMFEDIVILTKVGLCAPIYVAGEQWIRYRQHPESCVTQAVALGTVPASRLRVLTWMEGYLRRQAVTDRRVWAALRRELRPYRHPRLHRVVQGARRLSWRAEGALWSLADRILPSPAHHWLRRLRRGSL